MRRTTARDLNTDVNEANSRAHRVIQERNALREQNARLVEALREALDGHPPVLTGQCPVCHHYGKDCTAYKGTALLAKIDKER